MCQTMFSTILPSSVHNNLMRYRSFIIISTFHIKGLSNFLKTIKQQTWSLNWQFWTQRYWLQYLNDGNQDKLLAHGSEADTEKQKGIRSTEIRWGIKPMRWGRKTHLEDQRENSEAWVWHSLHVNRSHI